MDIGNLNRRIDVLEYTTNRDEFGGESGEWVKVKSLWANIKPVSGTEYFKAEKPQAENTTTITIRYNPRINVLNRIQYKEKTYEIIGVKDFNTSHAFTILNCKEKVDYGL